MVAIPTRVVSFANLGLSINEAVSETSVYCIVRDASFLGSNKP